MPNPKENHVLRQPRKPRSMHRPPAPAAAPAATPPSRLLPLGALAAGFGMFNVAALAQTAPAPAAAASAPKSEATLPAIPVKAKVETDANSVRATTSTIGKGNQELRDIPQSVTVITEKLMDDRRIDTLKEALHQTAGVTFLAAEGGEEDIRLRGFSLAASGDIYVDGLRDPAFYERDTFSYERVELLRGSASMLFGRGSTGGVVNQVSKQALLTNVSQVDLTVGNGNFLRFGGDFNIKTSETAALARQRDEHHRRRRRRQRQARQARHGADLPLGHRHERRVLCVGLLPAQQQRHQLRPAVAAQEGLGGSADTSATTRPA